LNGKASADFDTAEQLYRVGGNAEGTTEVLYQRAALSRRRGKLAEVRAPAQKTLEMARNTHDDYHQIRALLLMSNLLYVSGDIEGGQQEANEAIDLARRAGIETLAASGLVDLGTALFTKGDNEAAEPYLRNALETANRFQVPRIKGRAELILGQVLNKTGRTEEGSAALKQAIEHFEQAGEKGNAALASTTLARTLRDQGDYDASDRLFRQQLQQAESVKDEGGIVLAAQALGSVLLLREKYPEALTSFDRSQQVSHSIGDISKEAYSDVSRADVLRLLGRYPEAVDSLAAAEQLDQKLNGNKPLIASVNFSRAELHLSELNFAEVEKDVRKMMGAAGPGPLEASSKRLLGLQRIAIGRRPEGLALCEESVRRATPLKNVSLQKKSELALAEARWSSGDAVGSLALASALAEYFNRNDQHESELRALAIAISATRNADRARYVEKAKMALAKLRQVLGDGYSGFASRPDIRQTLVRAGLTSGI
jgi:tetratricopeptide (TPR) repeat protein